MSDPMTEFQLISDRQGIATLVWNVPGRSMNVFTETTMNKLDELIEHIIASAKPVTRLVAPGPLVAKTTPVLPDDLA